MQHDLLSDFNKRYGAYALVTGASEGIRQSFAGELDKAGKNVVLVARRQDRLNVLAQELGGKYKIMCPVIAADLSSTEQLSELIEMTEKLDIGLVHCAACTEGQNHECDYGVHDQALIELT